MKSRRSREKWTRNKDATIKKVAPPKSEKDATAKKRKVQRNRSGNPNPSHRFPNHNSIQTKHGLFSKFLHEEQVEIIKVMDGLDFADQIWLQIELKFSAIIRMQKIMWVEDEHNHNHLKETSGYSNSMDGDSTTFKIAYAYERYESYVRRKQERWLNIEIW